MTTVVSPSQIPHIWANQLQDNARTSNKNFYFEDKTIYSYGTHFPIAVLKDKDIVFFTTNTYSKTTSGHISATRSACSDKKIIYCLDPADANKSYHTQNLEDFDNKCKYIAKNKLRNANKPEIYLNQIAYQRQLFNDYCDYFKIKKSVRNKYKYILIESKDGGIKATDQEIKAQAKRLKDNIKRDIQKHKIDVENFRTFETRRIWTRNDCDYLRYNKETNRVETSQEIEIPVSIAKKFYQHIQAVVKNGGCLDCETKLMDYDVKEINAEFITIGCHHIKTDEIKKIAVLLNW